MKKSPLGYFKLHFGEAILPETLRVVSGMLPYKTFEPYAKSLMAKATSMPTG